MCIILLKKEKKQIIFKKERKTGIEPAPRIGFPFSGTENLRATITLLPLKIAHPPGIEPSQRVWTSLYGAEYHCATITLRVF